jgi:hypothetical protein
MCKLSIVRRVKRGHVKIMEDEYVRKKKESKRRIITSERKFGEVDSKYI